MPDFSTIGGLILMLAIAVGAFVVWAVMEMFNFDPQDRWEGEEPERVKCTQCHWSGLVTECFGATFCDCPQCLGPITGADGQWATRK